MVDDAPRPHEVERRVRERQVLGVRLAHVGRQAVQLEPRPRQRDRGRRQVDGRDVRARLREQARVHAGAAADLQHVLVA